MAITLNHTGFVVKDRDKALEFYRDGLGLEVERVSEGRGWGLDQVVGYENSHIKFAWLAGADGHYLELLEYVNPKGEERDPEVQFPRASIGAAHLAFIVEDVQEVFARLMSMGGKKLNPPPKEIRPGFTAVYLQDPDGNWIEIAEDSVHARSPFTIRQNTTPPKK